MESWSLLMSFSGTTESMATDEYDRGGGVERHRNFAVRPACLSGDSGPLPFGVPFSPSPTTQTCHPFCLMGQGVRIPAWER